MQLQEKYIPKSTARVHLFMGNRFTGKSTAISVLLYSIRKDVSKLIAYNSKKLDAYIGIIPDTNVIEDCSLELRDLLAWYEKKADHSESKTAVILDDVLYHQRGTDILGKIIKNPNVIIIIAQQYDTLPRSVHEYVDAVYMFASSNYGMTSQVYKTHFQEHYKSIDEFSGIMNGDKFLCRVKDKSSKHVEYVRFALVQDIKERDSAQIVQKWFRGWRFRKNVLWNPHTDIGGQYLALKAKEYVEEST